MDSLTSEQRQLVLSFIQITNYQQSSETVIPFLQSTNWNLESSIILYFETNEQANEQLNRNSRSTLNMASIPGAFPADNFNSVETNLTSNDRLGSFLDTMRRKISLPTKLFNESILHSQFSALSTKHKIIFIAQYILYTPVLLLSKITSVTFLLLASVFPILKKISHSRTGRRSEPKGRDPSQTARNFISKFNLYYDNDNSKIDFFEGGYTSALYIAKRDARFLLVYLHSEEHDDTNTFITETLLNTQFLKVVKDHNILVWGGNVLESESFQVSNNMNVTKYPFLGLLSLKSDTQETPQGTTTTAPTLNIALRVQGLISADKLVTKLASQIERLEPALIAIRSARQEQELSRMIRQQQDEAYEASLRRDRELSEQRKQEKLLKENRLKWLKWRSIKLKPEVTRKGDFARVAIRLLNGERISRSFDKTSKIEEIYAFVELYQQGLIGKSFENVTKPENFEFEFDFKLISPMPRQQLKNSEETSIQNEPIVFPNGNLIVEEIQINDE
ncbi:hypothetical protein WICMUC_005374 [Wickerhamomyces mucosus]|uniref:UBX domain-containing protein n=1 Tax=Wickerhamomyces mucosus TaxID=1378264 RepID=A0A9P8P842_9ASCO|nr:hypothetical protein WICMUC_005374 [Wickerhamomyces mucosus]